MQDSIFELTNRELGLLEKFDEFCQSRVAPFCKEWDCDERIPRDVFLECGRVGLLGLIAPLEIGGQALSMVAFSKAISLVTSYYPSLGFDLSVQNSLGVGHILQFGSESQCAAFLPNQIKGETLAGWALTEPEAGSDAGSLGSNATNLNGCWRISGQKMFTTQGANADFLIVISGSGTTDTGKKEISSFVVLKNEFEIVRVLPTLGMRGSDSTLIKLSESKAELIGKRGSGLKQSLFMLDRARVGMASVSIGIGKAALSHATSYSKNRQQFGKPISNFQSIQNLLVDSAIDIESGELLTLKAAKLLDQGHDRTPMASSMAKLFASEAATRTSNRCLQVFGGRGYLRDFPMEQYYRDAKFCEIGEGTSEIQKIIIARELLKRDVS